MENTTHYNGEVELIFDPQKHRYTINGKPAKGVTTVLQRLNKPALVVWAASEAKKYIEANLKPGVALDEVEIQQLAKDAMWAHRNRKDTAAEMGTFVHQFLQDWIEGNPQPMPINPQLQKAVNAFIKWYEKQTMEGNCEQRLCSPTLSLAGTVDFVGQLDGKLTILDWKSGSGIYPEYLYQMGAYAEMYDEEFGQKVEQVGVINCSVKAPFKTYFTSEVQPLKDIYKDLLSLDSKLTTIEERMK